MYISGELHNLAHTVQVRKVRHLDFCPCLLRGAGGGASIKDVNRSRAFAGIYLQYTYVASQFGVPGRYVPLSRYMYKCI